MNVLAELDAALAARDAELRRALEKTEAELVACEARCQALRDRIAEVRGVLTPQHGSSGVAARKHMTLHEAMHLVLGEAGPDGLAGPDLRDQVTSRGLYHQRDGKPVSINQIHARARNYPDLFSRREGRFVLADAEASHAGGDLAAVTVEPEAPDHA